MKKKNYIILILAMILLVLPMVSASDFNLKQNETSDLKLGCTDGSGVFCTAVTNCTLTLLDPNMNAIIDTQDMTRQSSYYNYTIDSSNLTSSGEYNGIMVCVGTAYYNEFTLGVSVEGFEPTISDSILYVSLLGLTILLMVLCIAGAFLINGKNEFSMGGDILKINFNKYLKQLLFFIAYLFFMFTTWIAWSISDKFLDLGIGSTIFYYAFIISWIFFFPILIAFTTISIISWILDLKLHKMKERGLKPR